MSIRLQIRERTIPKGRNNNGNEKAEAKRPTTESGAAKGVAAVPEPSMFGIGLKMDTVDDPFYPGPVPTDLVFPLPVSTEMTVLLAWTASYRCAAVNKSPKLKR